MNVRLTIQDPGPGDPPGRQYRFEFTGPGGAGAFGLAETDSGFHLLAGDGRAVGLIDFYYGQPGRPREPLRAPFRIIVDDLQSGDPLGSVEFFPQETRICLEADLTAERARFNGAPQIVCYRSDRS